MYFHFINMLRYLLVYASPEHSENCHLTVGFSLAGGDDRPWPNHLGVRDRFGWPMSSQVPLRLLRLRHGRGAATNRKFRQLLAHWRPHAVDRPVARLASPPPHVQVQFAMFPQAVHPQVRPGKVPVCLYLLNICTSTLPPANTTSLSPSAGQRALLLAKSPLLRSDPFLFLSPCFISENSAP